MQATPEAGGWQARLATPEAGLAIYALSSLWVTVMGVSVKFASAAGTPVLAIILARTTLGIVLALSACALQRVNPLGTQRKALLVRGLVGCGGVIGLLIAATRLPLAVVSLLGFLAPLVTAGLARVVLSEPIPRAVWLGLPPSLVGLLLVLRPWDQLGGLDPGGVLAAVVSPLCIGAAGVMVRKLASGGRPEHAQVVMLYLSVVTTLVVASFAFLTHAPVPSASVLLAAAPALLATGLAGWLMQLSVTLGLARAPAARATAMGYTAVVFMAAADWWCFAVPPHPMSCAGGAIIVLTALAVALRR